MKFKLACAALAAAAACAAPAHATSVALAADGAWNEFTVDDQAAPGFGTQWIDFNDGSPLTFDFTIAAGSVGTLTIVDAGFAGDTFHVTDFGAALGETSGVATGTTAGPVVFDFDQALADPTFSRGVFQLAAGTYRIGGLLAQSVLDDGLPLDSTNGAVRLQVAAVVPEPMNAALLLAGAGLVAGGLRRRGHRNAA